MKCIVDASRFVVKARDGWFLGAFTHRVCDTQLGKTICVSNEWSCDLVADALNVATGYKTMSEGSL